MPKISLPISTEDWHRFLAVFRDTAQEIFQREGWPFDDPRWFENVPASEEAILETQTRLNLRLPEEIKNFYRVSNGWPSDSTLNAAINRIQQWGSVDAISPSVHESAKWAESASWPDRANDDTKLLAFQHEQGTRVLRSIAISYNTDDRETILLDPLSDWNCGNWHHTNPAMSWCASSFGAYMIQRLDQLRAI